MSDPIKTFLGLVWKLKMKINSQNKFLDHLIENWSNGIWKSELKFQHFSQGFFRSEYLYHSYFPYLLINLNPNPLFKEYNPATFTIFSYFGWVWLKTTYYRLPLQRNAFVQCWKAWNFWCKAIIFSDYYFGGRVLWTLWDQNLDLYI